jgi:hypothetical protein
MSRHCVVLQRIHAHVLEVAGGLHAAVPHFVDEHEVHVDPGSAVLQLLGHAHCPRHVLRPHVRGQSLAAVVGPGDGLFLPAPSEGAMFNAPIISRWIDGMITLPASPPRSFVGVSADLGRVTST